MLIAQQSAAVLNETDPYFSSVVYLLNYQGPRGTNTFTDRSKAPKAITAATPGGGTVALAADNQKFSTTALRTTTTSGFSGNITTPSHTDFNIASGDFTIEWWFYPDALSNATFPANTMFHRSDSSNRFNFLYASGAHTFQWAVAAAVVGVTNAAHGMTAGGGWYHWACTRSGTTYTVWKNGVSMSSASGAAASDTAAVFSIGSHGTVGSNGTDGRFAGFRFTKGVCRYTAAFTPPNRPFPES